MQAFSKPAEPSPSLTLAQTHYENFPVASLLLPAHLRHAVTVIYQFAREADDIADEGDATEASRLQALQAYEDELLLIQAYIKPAKPLFIALQQVVNTHKLDVQLLLDLIDAFKQDVVKTRYANVDEVLDYCRRSANPVGRLMLQLYGSDTPQHRLWSDQICSALQLINFYQDIAQDLQKHGAVGRIYLSQDEMLTAGISEQDLRQQRVYTPWQAFFMHNVMRAETMLLAGKPLGRALPGRIGFELRMMIAGGERILHKLKSCRGDIYHHRPTLKAYDWLLILLKALFKQ
ncbi:squalene synthase HpnC [Methylophilus sp. UBA6697]|jgi:squalene synthase HpnC|uniref:squalene synthase HpnC n=1 Tax=Methylophilus sp. UBA6697 TaxID=1946902 RepID=UPI000ED0BA65|nr:squalene synthase HpnC [Methylophilus sp. UBA6697]HCU84830.1 squalene synthase HpnC [Methylophilus sp.]